VSECAAASRPAEVLSVDLSSLSRQRRSAHVAAVASLPQLLRPVANGQGTAADRGPAGGGGPAGDRGPGDGPRESGPPGDIQVIDAADPAWPRLAAEALDRPARGVLLTPPALAAVFEVADLAARTESVGCPVVVATPVPYDTTVQNGIARLHADRETLSFADSIVTVTAGAHGPRCALGAALLTQLAAIRMAVGPVSGLTMSYETEHAYCAVAACGEVTVSLAGLVSGYPVAGLRMDLVGARRRHAIRVAGPFAASPATFATYNASGMSVLPPSYESGLRSAWRDLHAAVTTAQPVRYGLRELTRDLTSAPGAY
jgi:hypothetical protein